MIGTCNCTTQMEMYPGNAEPEPIDEELCVCTAFTPYLRLPGQPNMGQL